MKILIVGGTGFIGQHLARYFVQHDVTILTRQTKPKPAEANTRYIQRLTNDLAFDAIINLAGENLNKKRWSRQFKQELYDSRIKTTQHLLEYIRTAEHKPAVLLNASAVGYYGHHPKEEFTEQSAPVLGSFSQHLCADWEKLALSAQQDGVRVCVMRFGVVLGRDGGFMRQMLPVFKLGLGATFGDGQQWFSWIHIVDLIKAIDFLLQQSPLNGPFNLVSPQPVTQRAFSQALAMTLKRPLWLNVPAKVTKMLLGDVADELILYGQKVYPERLMDAGFRFTYPTLQAALQHLS